VATIQLIPLGTMDIELGEPVIVGDGPKGSRMVVDVLSVKLRGERVQAELATNDAADWLTISDNGKLGALDVRLTLKTEDGAFIYVEYSGRMDMEAGLIAVAPTFQTGSPDYSWLNRIQGVAAGSVNADTGLLTYTLYEAQAVPD
jgi:hypothetical protein